MMEQNVCFLIQSYQMLLVSHLHIVKPNVVLQTNIRIYI